MITCAWRRADGCTDSRLELEIADRAVVAVESSVSKANANGVNFNIAKSIQIIGFV